jgi:hypothetical protein
MRDAIRGVRLYPKMSDPKIANFRDFYPHEIWQFLSVFRLNPRRWPIFIRTMDQTSKKSKNFLPRFAATFLRF